MVRAVDESSLLPLGGIGVYPFSDVVNSELELRAAMGEPHSSVVTKTINILDKHCRVYISRSPFLLIASSDGQGHFDVSPKGDPPGFVSILDDHTLVIPERLGNKRADTFNNVLSNPSVGLIFLIPGKRETLRISGKARIIRDADVLDRMSVKGRAPQFGLAVHVEEAFFHCAKCIVRSKLWSPAEWPYTEGLPSLAQTMVDGGKLEMPVEEMQEGIEQDEAERLY